MVRKSVWMVLMNSMPQRCDAAPMPALAWARATVSVSPPAAYGTSMVMVLVGYCCASELVQNAIDATSDVTNEIRFIMGSSGEGAILRKGKLARPAAW